MFPAFTYPSIWYQSVSVLLWNTIEQILHLDFPALTSSKKFSLVLHLFLPLLGVLALSIHTKKEAFERL
jgi:hypothetical protein